jgi:hypothetical protein
MPDENASADLVVGRALSIADDPAAMSTTVVLHSNRVSRLDACQASGTLCVTPHLSCTADSEHAFHAVDGGARVSHQPFTQIPAHLYRGARETKSESRKEPAITWKATRERRRSDACSITEMSVGKLDRINCADLCLRLADVMTGIDGIHWQGEPQFR